MWPVMGVICAQNGRGREFTGPKPTGNRRRTDRVHDAGMSDPLARQPFGWSRAGSGVQISYSGRPVKMLQGPAASTLIEQLSRVSPAEAQQELSRLAEGK